MAARAPNAAPFEEKITEAIVPLSSVSLITCDPTILSSLKSLSRSCQRSKQVVGIDVQMTTRALDMSDR